MDVECYNVYYADNLPCKPTFSGFLCAWPVIGILLVAMHVVSMGVGWGIHISKSNDMKIRWDHFSHAWINIVRNAHPFSREGG